MAENLTGSRDSSALTQTPQVSLMSGHGNKFYRNFFHFFFIHCTVLDSQLRLVRCFLLAEGLPSAGYFIDTLIHSFWPGFRGMLYKPTRTKYVFVILIGLLWGLKSPATLSDLRLFKAT